MIENEIYCYVEVLRMQKSVVVSGLDIKFSDILSSFKTCWSSLLQLLMALWRSLLRNDEASLFETFGTLKIRNFGNTTSCLQLLRKSMSNFRFFFFCISIKQLNLSKTKRWILEKLITYIVFSPKTVQKWWIGIWTQCQNIIIFNVLKQSNNLKSNKWISITEAQR